MERYSSNLESRKSGGFEAANRGVNRITCDWGLPVENRPSGVRVATLPNCAAVDVRGFSYEGSPVAICPLHVPVMVLAATP